LLVLLLAVYFLLLSQRAVLLIRTGEVLPVLLGAGLLVLPLLAGWLVFAELRFGYSTQLMAAELAAEGGLPRDDLPRRPSGRVDRSAAAAAFAARRGEVEAEPGDWRGWFRLAIAYDDAGDRRRARGAMRRAVLLHRNS
jgi:cytochrome c-type biogenesis protein CcmH/NrfG